MKVLQRGHEFRAYGLSGGRASIEGSKGVRLGRVL